jgi:prepilin-type N-terminal cleavage/methylation domain-containing protein
MIPSRRHKRVQAGMSLVEVMIAVGVLAVGLAAILGNIFSLHATRQTTVDLTQARMVAEYLHQTIQASKWTDLNDRTKPESYLTWARHPDANGVADDTECLGDDPQLPLVAGSQSPDQRRRLPFRTKLDDLRVYVEYFRAHTAVDSAGNELVDGGLPCRGGLLESDIVNAQIVPGDMASRPRGGLTGSTVLGQAGVIPSLTAPASVAPLRLPDIASIASQVGTRLAENDTVAVRISVVWRDRSGANAGAGNRMLMTRITGRMP